MAQIDKPGLHFNTIIWTGSGNSSRSFTGVGFAPDFVWVKNRGGSNAIAHSLYDKVRGAGANKELVSNSTTAEGGENHDSYDYLSSFDSDGFSSTYVGNTAYYFNESGSNYVGWNWKANGAGSANTDGSINSTVSVNTTAGFSIVSYTGNGSAGATIGHGLGATPAVIIQKIRSSTGNWLVYHHKNTSAPETDFLRLNTNNATADEATIFNDTAPTSSVFSVGTESTINGNGNTCIAYCFAEKKGYSKFGSYTGNGNADGPFIYTGFKPAWVMIKPSSYSNSWGIFDNKRPGYNVTKNRLEADGNGVENTNLDYFDFLSNGFKVRTSNGHPNTSGGTLIYMAFAENPIVGSNNIPAVAK